MELEVRGGFDFSWVENDVKGNEVNDDKGIFFSLQIECEGIGFLEETLQDYVLRSSALPHTRIPRRDDG